MVNNAGVFLPSPTAQLRTDDWRTEIDVNITGQMNVIAAFGCGR